VRADRWQLPEILGLVLGLMAMAAGALLAASPAPTAAGLTPAGYRVGDLVLPAKSPGVYSGGAVVIISSPSDGTTLSAADGLIGPSAFSGFCSTTATSEQCSFLLGKTTYQAVDRLTGRRGARAWTRTYSNGVKVQIPLLSSDAPVPLPLGLH
jgi:hypothetical protein